jgi:hypothetical protein
VLGLIAIAVALQFSPERQRRRTAARLPVGADSAVVLRTLGARPTRCPAGAMEHLRGELNLPDEIVIDSAMIQIRRDTRQRWLYPGQSGCTPRRGETEVGIDAAGRVLWIQPAAQHGDVRLSPRITY